MEKERPVPKVHKEELYKAYIKPADPCCDTFHRIQYRRVYLSMILARFSRPQNKDKLLKCDIKIYTLYTIDGQLFFLITNFPYKSLY